MGTRAFVREDLGEGIGWSVYAMRDMWSDVVRRVLSTRLVREGRSIVR